MRPTLKHFPDKPFEQDPSYLLKLDQSGNYNCQAKIDGWRIVLIFTETRIEFLSRHNKNHTADIEPEIKEAAAALRQHFPVNSQIDAEWLSRRSCSKEYDLAPKLFLLDVIRLGNEWLLSKPYASRFQLLQNMIANINTQWITLPEMAAPGTYAEFFEKQKGIPYTEGVVLKHKDSKLRGNIKESVKNPLWIKIKWRGASDGEMTMGHLRLKRG